LQVMHSTYIAIFSTTTLPDSNMAQKNGGIKSFGIRAPLIHFSH